MHYIKKQFARLLRKESTITERTVWLRLRNRNYKNLKFRRQHVIDGFVVDFYCPELRLALEIDGEIHEKQKEYDNLRQELIEKRYISFIRVTCEDVEKDMQILFNKIDYYITPPSPDR